LHDWFGHAPGYKIQQAGDYQNQCCAAVSQEKALILYCILQPGKVIGQADNTADFPNWPPLVAFLLRLISVICSNSKLIWSHKCCNIKVAGHTHGESLWMPKRLAGKTAKNLVALMRG
jgi:hypothetical protein